MIDWLRSGVLIALLSFAGVASAIAGTITMSLQDVGDNVVFDFQGTLEGIGDPSFTGANSSANLMSPILPRINSLPGSYARYDFGGSEYVPFGDGAGLVYERPSTSTSSGDVFGFAIFADSSRVLFLPSGYTSGTSLEGQAVFFGTSLDSIGAVRGRYVYEFGDNTLNLTVGSDTAVIPLPATGLLLLSVLGSLVLMKRCRQVG